MYEKFEWKYLETSEVILSLYDKTINRASSCPNSNIISIKMQLNSTHITVFTIRKYLCHTRQILWAWWSGVQTPGRDKKLFCSKNVQMGSRSTQPPIGAPSQGVKWLQHKADHLYLLLQRLRMNGPTALLSHMHKTCVGTALLFYTSQCSKKQGVGSLILHCLHAFFEQICKKKPGLGVGCPLNEALRSFSKTIWTI
jgi:hypothetical protein